jgi:hypothetical protein
MSRAADKYDIDAVADLLAVSIASALISGGFYTYEDARRTNADEGWAYETLRGESAATSSASSRCT